MIAIRVSKALLANTELSHYRIVSKIGAGGMGEVYRAHDGRLDREVAVKLLPADFAADKSRLQRFEQEAKAGWPAFCISQIQSNSGKWSESEGRTQLVCGVKTPCFGWEMR